MQSDSSMTPAPPVSKPALAINDSRARVARTGKGTRLVVAGQGSNLLRRLTGLALGVDPGERTDGIEASDSEVGGVAALDDHNAPVVVEGLQARLPHLLVRDGAGELEEAISWILEQKRAETVGVHPDRKLFDGDGSAEVDNISNKVGQIDFGIVYLDHCPILRKPFLSDIERGRWDDVAEDTVLPVLPVFGDVRAEFLEGSDRLPRLLQLVQGVIYLRLSVLHILLLSNSILQPGPEMICLPLISDLMAAICFSTTVSPNSKTFRRR